jgi:LCP family protein required for cell wall assembly
MRLPGWAFLLAMLALIGATAVCGTGAFILARQFAIDLGESGVEVVSAEDLLRTLPTVTPTFTPEPTATLEPGVTPSPTVPVPTATPDPLAGYEVWQDPRRVNILLMGIDQRRGETGFFRTDTMLVASIDPVRKTAGLLSIPRDLYVDIPGYQQYRINQANYIGDANNYPGGGPALAMATVTQNLGIRVEKYVMVNFDLFETVVRLIAPRGVEVCPPAPIDDPDYPDAGYGTFPIYFPAGCQRLDAVRLLQYARTRATQGGDFDRAARQQEVLQALRNEVLSAGGIVNFIGVAPRLWVELSDSYRTNLSLEEIISLGLLAQEIPRENIRSGVIGPQQTRPATTADGDQVLVPVYGTMRALFQEVFGDAPVTRASGESATDLASLRELANAERARIVIFNGTQVSGLAGATRELLTSRGVTIADIGSQTPPQNQPTTIFNYGNKPSTARYLAALLNVPETRIQPGLDGATTADILVVVGTDIQPLLGGG